MKSTPIIFIIFNSINKHLSHTSQMHTHAYTWRVHDLKPYSGIQGWRERLWTLVDPDMYMRCVDIFPYYSLCFSSLILPKRLYHPLYHRQLHDWLSPSPQHHVWLHPPYILLLFVRTFSPLFTCINQVGTMLYSTLIWVLCSLSQQLSKSWNWLHCSLQVLWLILLVTS